jgi:hypothetical protein
MDTLLSNATSSFQATTGFSLDSVVTWMWTNILSPILGGGLASIYELRYVIIALALIILVVFFAFKAWHIWRGH